MAGSQPHALALAAKPMSVKEITSKAEDFDFNPSIGLKYWLRTADTLLREARIYTREHNDQQAYLLLFRYATLVMDKIPWHPEAKLPEHRQTLKAARKAAPTALARLELLKPSIEARYLSWEQEILRRREAAAAAGEPQSRMAASDPAVAGNMMTLGAAEHSELAVKMGNSEARRRDAARQSRQGGVATDEEHERRTAGLWDDWEAALSKDGATSSRQDDQMRLNMEASRRRLDGPNDILPGAIRQRPPKPLPRPTRPDQQRNGRSGYHYPSINKSQPLRYDNNSYESRPRSESPRGAPLPPKPPKERLEQPQSAPTPPPYPGRPEEENPSTSFVKPPPSYTFRPSAYLENGNPLRTVFLPPTLRQEFLAHAAPNTRKNLETCGMLCGTLISNALFVSKVVIPEQESTSDTCETINESAFFDYCAAEDLMVLGWIHTHPSQTCFMSSRDLHTHCGYQIMMPESIAIVCAPSKDPSWGVFRLTDPPGMQSVLNCRKTGLFHPHDERNIYTDALKPGHVFEAEGLGFEVVDLRP